MAVSIKDIKRGEDFFKGIFNKTSKDSFSESEIEYLRDIYQSNLFGEVLHDPRLPQHLESTDYRLCFLESLYEGIERAKNYGNKNIEEAEKSFIDEHFGSGSELLDRLNKFKSSYKFASVTPFAVRAIENKIEELSNTHIVDEVEKTIDEALKDGQGLDVDKEVNDAFLEGDKYFGFLPQAYQQAVRKVVEEGNGNVVVPLSKKDEQTDTSKTGYKKINRPRTRLAQLNPDTTPENQIVQMTDTEKIKTWIEGGQSVLLRGPSGIGKTERIKELYPNLIYLKLTNNMFPEKVVGSMNLQTGQAIPPDFAKQAILCCATDDEKGLIEENIQNIYSIADTIYERSKTSNEKVVILLDELLNVKPAIQSLVYTLVLNKVIETGQGLKLPANTVVVATGNQKKFSVVSEDLAEPLEKRFDHILDMQPKVGDWIYEYAIPHQVHPAVVSYIFTKYNESGKSENLSKIGYFYEGPEIAEKHIDKNGCRGKTNDPRGWVSISNMLKSFEKSLEEGKYIGKDVEDLLRTSLETKLRDEWANEFFHFYNIPAITPEDVVEGNYDVGYLPDNINDKFACMAGLLGANENQVAMCRDFVREYCDPEYLYIYDMYWAGKDEDKMQRIYELQEEEKFQNEFQEGGINQNEFQEGGISQ